MSDEPNTLVHILSTAQVCTSMHPKQIFLMNNLCFRVLVYGGSGGVGTFAIQVNLVVITSFYQLKILVIGLDNSKLCTGLLEHVAL